MLMADAMDLELQMAGLRVSAKAIELATRNIPTRCDTPGADAALAFVDDDLGNALRKVRAAIALVAVHIVRMGE